MPQNEVGKSISCNHCSEKQNLTWFYMLVLFQKITANVAVEKQYPTMMHFLRELFAKTAVWYCTVAYTCTGVYKSLRKCGSSYNVSRSCARYQTKDVRELSWMSHGVIRFWFLLNFLFILAFFDIIGSLSISRVFPSGILDRWKSSCSDISRTIIKFDYIN